MDTHILKDMVDLIRTEQERRSSLLNAEDQDYAYDHWVFWDEPFLNELCLMFLVTLRHQVEREIIGLAARAVDAGREISSMQYKERIEQLQTDRKTYRSWNWKKIYETLKIESCDKNHFYKVLRVLTNSYKHDFSKEPNEKLLTELRLKTELNYAPLPESDTFRKGLADFLGIGKDASYCDIAERFVDIASDFLAEVKSRTVLSKVKSSGVSLKPSDFEG